MIDTGVRGHALTAWHAAPLLIERNGLAVLTGYTQGGEDDVLAGHLFRDLAITAISRLVRMLAHDYTRASFTLRSPRGWDGIDAAQWNNGICVTER